jgi:hypothetical protein
MAYRIEWRRGGAIKRFSGTVTFEDVLRSEQSISGSIHFKDLRYVISDYSEAKYEGITETQRADVNALRIGGFFINRNIKYAFVMANPLVEQHIQDAIKGGEMLYQTRVFRHFAQAAQWVGLNLSQAPDTG